MEANERQSRGTTRTVWSQPAELGELRGVVPDDLGRDGVGSSRIARSRCRSSSSAVRSAPRDGLVSVAGASAWGAMQSHPPSRASFIT